MAILTCPHCAARFSLSDEALGPQGRRVKCSACGGIWFEKGAQEEGESVEEIPLTAQKRTTKPSYGATYHLTGTLMGYGAAFVVFILIALVLLLGREAVMQAWPAAAVIYHLFGLGHVPHHP